MIYSISHYPSSLPAMAFYRLGTSNCFIAFDWGSNTEKKKIKIWFQDASNVNMILQKEYPNEVKARTTKICYVASRQIYVTYSEDQFLRLYAYQCQQLKLLGTVISFYLVRTMCYNEQTAELITGSKGAIIFWIFNNEFSVLNISRVMEIKNGFFVSDLTLERGYRYMVALCEYLVIVFDCQKKVEIHSFGEEQRLPLTCFTMHWIERYVYTGDKYGSVHVWSIDTGHRLSEIKAHMSAISSIVLNPTVHVLLTASKDHMVKEWSLSTLELLRSLSMEEEVLHLQLINENVFYCFTTYTFSIWTLNTFYKLFNAMGSSVKKMKRVQSLSGKARILVSSDDDIIRCLSPVTGELLFLTWPFLVLEKALDYIYDPETEELFVVTGSPDIHVIDTSICPCSSKYIIITSENKDDTVVCLASSRQMLMGKVSCLIFSGHMSGYIRLISPPDYCMDECKIHNGAIITMQCLSNDDPHMVTSELRLMCSYGMDNYIFLTNIAVKVNTITLELLTSIFCKCKLQYIMLVPEWLWTITAKNTIRLWKVQELLSSEKQHSVIKKKDNQMSRITSLDYCSTLGLFLTGYQDGTVRVCDTKSNMLAEFKISQNFNSACFANPWADVLVAFNSNIYVIPGLQYLQEEQLKCLAAQNIADDSIEDPLPFLPSIFLTSDRPLIPKYLQFRKEKTTYKRIQSIKSNKAILIKKSIVKVVKIMPQELESKSDSEQAERNKPGDGTVGLRMMDRQDALLSIQEWQKSDILQDQNLLPSPYGLMEYKPVTLDLEPVSKLKPDFPIAPDGYIPNSVIRVPIWPHCSPNNLLDFMDNRKGDQVKDQPAALDLLTQIARSKWLGKNLNDINLESVIQALLDRMTQVPMTIYKCCTKALTRILQAYIIPQNLKTSIARRLYEDTYDKHNSKRLEAWNALDSMQLLNLEAVIHLARALLDADVRLRDKARSLLASSAKIITKTSLMKIMQRHAVIQDLMSLPSKHSKEKAETADQAMNLKTLDSLCQQLNNNLTNNLQFVNIKAIKPPTTIKALHAIDHIVAMRFTEAPKSLEILKPVKAIKRIKITQYTEDIKVMDVTISIKITKVLKTMKAVKPKDDFELTEATSTTGITKGTERTNSNKVMKCKETITPMYTTKPMVVTIKTKPKEIHKYMKKYMLSEDTVSMKSTDNGQEKLPYAKQAKPYFWLPELTDMTYVNKKWTPHEEPIDMWDDSEMDESSKEKNELPRKGRMVFRTNDKEEKEKVKEYSDLQPREHKKAKKSTCSSSQTRKLLGHEDCTLNIYCTEVSPYKLPLGIPTWEGKQKKIPTQLKGSSMNYLTSSSSRSSSSSRTTVRHINHGVPFSRTPSVESLVTQAVSLDDEQCKKEPHRFKIDPNVHYDTDHSRWKDHLYKLIECHGFRSLKNRSLIFDHIDNYKRRTGHIRDKNYSNDPKDLHTAKNTKYWEGMNLGPEMKGTTKMSAITPFEIERDLWPGLKMKLKKDTILSSSINRKVHFHPLHQERGGDDLTMTKTTSFETDSG
nr:WD repeat-containing protein 87 isoform X2 [Geotrypetes seraphini]